MRRLGGVKPDFSAWVTMVTNGSTARDIADRTDIPLRTIQHQLSTGRVTIEAAVRIATAFDYSPIRALIQLGVIDSSWASVPDISAALEQATTDQLVTTIHQRLTAADTLRSELGMTNTTDAGNGVPRANLHAALTRVSDDPERAMAVLSAAGLLDKADQSLPDLLEFPAGSASRQRIADKAKDGQFYLGRQHYEAIGEIEDTYWHSSNLLITGGTGAGKTETLHTIATGALLPSGNTNVLIISGKGTSIEFNDLAPTDGNLRIIDMTDRTQTVLEAAAAIHAVLSSLEAHGGTLPVRQLILIDELSDLSALADGENEAGEAVQQAMEDLLAIWTMASNVHIAVATQDPRPSALPAELVALLGQRLELGREPDSQKNRHKIPKGRGLLSNSDIPGSLAYPVQVAYVTDGK